MYSTNFWGVFDPMPYGIFIKVDVILPLLEGVLNVIMG